MSQATYSIDRKPLRWLLFATLAGVLPLIWLGLYGSGSFPRGWLNATVFVAVCVAILPVFAHGFSRFIYPIGTISVTPVSVRFPNIMLGTEEIYWRDVKEVRPWKFLNLHFLGLRSSAKIVFLPLFVQSRQHYIEQLATGLEHVNGIQEAVSVISAKTSATAGDKA